MSDLAAPWRDRMNLVCFEPLAHERPWTLETYLKIGGYEAWKKILAEKPPASRSSRSSRHRGCVVAAARASRPA